MKLLGLSERKFWALMPPVLLPYQATWIQDQSPVKLTQKSRRIGISWADAADAALTAAQANGHDCWYIGYNYDMAEQYIADVASWARAYNLVAHAVEETVVDEDNDILAFRVRFASGFRVTALSSRPTNLRNKKGRIVIDEAAFHNDLDELLKAALAIVMWGGRVSIISTHNGSDNAYNKLVEGIVKGEKNFSLHTYPLRTAIADGLYQRICLVTNTVYSLEAEQEWEASLRKIYGDAAGEELDCIPKVLTGRIYDALLPSHLLQQHPSTHWARTVLGVDWGDVNPALAVAGCDHQGQWVLLERWHPTEGVVVPGHVHFARAEEMVQRWHVRRVWCGHDRPSTIDEWQKKLSQYGCAVAKAYNRVAEGNAAINNLLAQGLLHYSPQCEDLHRRSESYRRAKDKFANFLDEPAPGQDDHDIDAARYAIASEVLTGKGDYGYTSAAPIANAHPYSSTF
jgi:hypothetical protein